MNTRMIVPRFAQAARAFSTSPAHNLAKLQLIGRLADVPEVRATSTGREITKYALGVATGPRNEQGERGVSWFKLTSFAEQAARDVLTNLPKGSLLYVEADASFDSYEVEGQKRSSLNLVAKNFSILSRPRTDSAGSEGDAVQDPQSGLGAS